MASEIRVPDLGGFSDVPVIDVLVKEGDRVEVDTPLITLETEKATMDVPSSAAGRITALKIKKGAKVSQGSVIAEIEADASAGKPAATTSQAQPQAKDDFKGDSDPTVRQPSPLSTGNKGPAPAASSAPAPAAPGAPSSPAQGSAPKPERAAPVADAGTLDFSGVHASPSVRKFARELGVDLTRVKGSGPKERITPDDVKAWVKRALTEGQGVPAGAALPKVPVVDFAKFGPVETKPLSRIQRISGPRLHASWVNVPHVWQMDLADFTDVEETRTRLKAKAIREGIKLTPLAFILKACVKTLQEFPQFNASLDATGENLVLKKYLHVGFAADTPSGLVVPVIRDANRKDLYELARDLGELSAKARDGKLTAQEMQGGCFTISSLGSIGGTGFTPIINAPEVAILGVAKASHQPVYQDGKFVPRLMLPITLGYDHRVIDGALAVRFTTALVKALGDVRGLLEAIP
jgi:pyruvate dehydrogenase E2 component (dihydrolipoamide acetyltransferase)